MAISREPVRLTSNPADRAAAVRKIRAMQAWLDALGPRLVLHEATWEPHDWSDFD